MNERERRVFLIEYLLRESGRIQRIPDDEGGQRRLLRSLMNVRKPKEIGNDFLTVQDEYLRGRIAENGIMDSARLQYKEGISLWQGDITTLKADAIVNAANSQLLGCFAPCHACIDNCIHTFAGVQLRLECAEMMQGKEEPTGKARITNAYNLPCKFVLHTVGPIVNGRLSEAHKKLLASCYESCLSLAEQNGAKSIAFPCISTGVFRFPNDEAAKIAVTAVREYKQRTGSGIKVIFNVFKDVDFQLYQKLLN